MQGLAVTEVLHKVYEKVRCGAVLWRYYAAVQAAVRTAWGRCCRAAAAQCRFACWRCPRLVQVDEKGAEAAAVTAIAVTTSAPVQTK